MYGILPEINETFTAARNLVDYTYMLCEPFTLYRPAMRIDGDQWCALYGENLQDGVAGFGGSPSEAVAAFNKAWNEKLPKKIDKMVVKQTT